MRRQLFGLLMMLFLAACADDVLVLPTATAVPPPTSLPTPTPTLTPTPILFRLSADPAIPSTIVQSAQQSLGPQFIWTEEMEEADVHLVIGEGQLVATWVYAVAAAFPTVRDAVTTADLQTLWHSGQLVVNEETAVAMNQLWGQPATIAIVEDVVAALWADRTAYGLVPFEQLTPDLKVLAVDGMSPLLADFEADAYPLLVKIGVMGEETAVARFLAQWQPITNREADKLTRVAMTGVTALTRATALQMEVYGIQFPGTAVAPNLQTADIAHVSHEVSFAPNCPYPNPVGSTSFCARDSYFGLLKEIGIDVVELTGNHLNDYGRDNMIHSLALYDGAGMLTFGGGENLEDAALPALFEHNGNHIAFVGCNAVGPNYAWATADLAGAGMCDEAFYTQITTLSQQGYVVIATLQYSEYYHYAATAVQKEAFAAVAAAGASAVSGSQGHHAQGFAFHDGAFIHYGLGNLFFDQMDMLGTRQTFIDNYVIYDGRLLSVELWTGLIESWCCPRLMTVAERVQVLTAVFQASDW